MGGSITPIRAWATTSVRLPCIRGIDNTMAAIAPTSETTARIRRVRASSARAASPRCCSSNTSSSAAGAWAV
jgi:hypothetical protein